MGGGIAYFSMANEANELIMLWRIGFLTNGQKIPYFMAEDLEAVLKGLGRKYSITSYNSKFSCADSVENRAQLFKFLFNDHLEKFSIETIKNLNEFIDSRSEGSEIRLKLNDYIYSVRGESK